MSCDRHYGFVNYPECSGNGICVNGQCICNPGWTGVSEMEIENGVDCQIYLPTIKIFAIIYIILSFPGIVYEIISLFGLSRLYSTKTACYVACLVTNICGYIYVILKLVDPLKYVVGRSLLLAFTQSVLGAAAQCVGTSYTLLLLKFLRGYLKMLRIDRREKFQKYSKMWTYVMMVSPFYVFLGMFIVQLLCIFSNPKYSTYFSIGMSSILFIAYAALVLCLGSISRMFISEIKIVVEKTSLNNSDPTITPASKMNNHGEIQSLLINSSSIYNQVMPFLYSGMILYATNLSWHFFRRTQSYQVILQMMSINIIVPLFLHSLQTSTRMHANILKATSQASKSSKAKSSKVGPASEKSSSQNPKSLPVSCKLDADLNYTIVPVNSV